MEFKRVEFIDALKGFAIFLVIWGHTIQQFDVDSNYLFAFIYSFHMPLFFIISGFFFQSSLKLKFNEFLYKKGMQLFYTWFLWCVLLGIYQFATHRLDNAGPMQVGILVFNRYFWFLRQLFASYLIAYLGYKLFKKDVWVAIIIICFVIVFPFFRLQSFYLPLFLFGIFLKQYYSFIANHLNKLLLSSFIVFGICLFFWKSDYLQVFPALFSIKTFSYTFPNWQQSLFRWLIGISGSLFFFVLFWKTYMPNAIYSYLNTRGKYTLTIYILQVIILENLLPMFISFSDVDRWVFLLITIPFSLVILELCFRIAMGIRKYKKIELFLFGSVSQK
jgi:fucose 4-O-acetylase-like acetyltransferase